MGIEFELKYRATRQQQEKILQSVSGREQVYRMATTYYDTPTGAFSKANCTLRQRMENNISICTLKAPTQDLGRREWEVEAPTMEDGLSMLCKLDGPAHILSLAKEGLLPVCGARFTRIARTVTVADGTLELAVDSGVLTGGWQEVPLCEVEVEQKTCSQEACLAFARDLSQKFGLIPEPLSKFARAIALYKGE